MVKEKEKEWVFYYNIAPWKGDRYEGDWKNDKKEGRGVYFIIMEIEKWGITLMIQEQESMLHFIAMEKFHQIFSNV